MIHLMPLALAGPFILLLYIIYYSICSLNATKILPFMKNQGLYVCAAYQLMSSSTYVVYCTIIKSRW